MQEISAITMGLLAGLTTWAFTALGAAVVFMPWRISTRFLDIMLGGAAGVMLAASVWSLLLPAMETAEPTWGSWRFIPAAGGFILGGVCLRMLDMALPHIHPRTGDKDGAPSRLPRNFLLFLSVTLHNIPEAAAVGVSFGAAAVSPDLGVAPAILLMLAIGLQNLPEGMAVSVPMLHEGMSARKAFLYGQFSGAVEPVACVAGAVLAASALPVLPWALSLAAGAMIFVVVEEVIPAFRCNDNSDPATMGVIAGFALMMCLDMALG